MPHVFKGQIAHYSGLPEFQERAVRTLNELFGRVKPLEVFDFSEDSDAGEYTAIGYAHGEKLPEEQLPGDDISDAILEILDGTVATCDLRDVASTPWVDSICAVAIKLNEVLTPKTPIVPKKSAPEKDKAKHGKNNKQR